MRHKSLFRYAFAWAIGLLASLSPVAFAEAAKPLELMQVHACRATSSLLLLRNEGFQESYKTRLETDLAALEGALQSFPQASAGLRSSHAELVTQIRRGVSFGPKEEDMPWRYPQELSRALRDFLTAAHQPSQGEPQQELPAQIEYLAVQYLYRSYLGTFETAREQADQYLGQDERTLVPAIDARLSQLDDKSNPAVGKLKTRWGYLRAALLDMNSLSSALVSASGRPFAPTTVDRHARALSEQLLTLNAQP